MSLFKLEFEKTSIGIINISEVRGYQKALRSLYEYLEHKTEFNPAKRYIDAVDLLDEITNVNKKIGELLLKEDAILNP